ncbi:pyridoxal-phosphate dependent enzyme [Sulfitobacter sp. TSTF-M16]|uniref:Pyridoxal-phosphate dependent enzyme n=1 Tax=Sulfitobacter aestuariivivens TaxID=2766981 RepID=A0A927D5C4_9RHOB|nr:pyridoxal-phosphate dependent enzyme [Sulfitobacter aestuariivivens]MBD3664109.1 pyridoxal-phosphate dependent enzyme [Sulfitobacter aestuariivivens]
MDILYTTRPVAIAGVDDIPYPSVDAARPAEMLKRCPAAAETQLVNSQAIATEAGVAEVWIKDERGRMGLGSFKALGAAYVVADDAAEGRIAGRTYVAASAGNHGMSVAAGAHAFSARSVVYIAETVPQAFADRLTAQGAEVVREGEMYEASMAAAQKAAEDNDWALLSDSSWPGYTKRPHRLMEGYLVLMAEAVDQMAAPPTHIFLQAGVGGLAAAAAAYVREVWGDAPRIIVVEPEVAPALHGSIAAGSPVESSGPVSEMGRLDCKMPSLIALKGLARDADAFALISEDEAQVGAGTAMVAGLASTPSGAAGISGLLAMSGDQKTALGLDAQSRVLCVLSEGPEG